MSPPPSEAVAAGLAAGSVSLQADALDFLGDAGNYAISLFVVGMALRYRATAAFVKGATMGLFGLWVLGLTFWHAWHGTLPHAFTMGAVGTAALIANAVSKRCLATLNPGIYVKKIKQDNDRTSPSQHVFRNRRLGDLEAELEQLTMNTRRAPKRIFLAHTAHEISGFLINPGPAAWIVRSPAPPGAKTHPVPANDGLRTHDRRGVADIGETPIQPDEQRPITAGKPQPFRSLSVQNVQLMAKDEDFGFSSVHGNESSRTYIRAKV